MAYQYSPTFQLGPDTTEYYKIPGSEKFVSTAEFEGHKILKVSKEALELLSETAFHDVNFFLRRSHNEQVASILSDHHASENDKYVALSMLRNAEVASKGRLPFCQDTGTAIVHAEKGQGVWTGFDEAEPLSQGIFNTYRNNALRYSQNVAYDMYTERNSHCNLPAQIDIEATEGNEFKFLCVVKGGGSANKSYLYQMTKAVLRPDVLIPFLLEKIESLGTAACPPYHIAIVVGGTSAEKNLLTVKLASTKFYDSLPTVGDDSGRAFRDVAIEEILQKKCEDLGLGAQFGGTHFAHDIRVIRLSRHGASCPIGLGVSCSADRNIKAKINTDGVWIEKLDYEPYKLIPDELREAGETGAVKVDLNRPMAEICAQLSKYPVSTRLSLTGTIIVARDMAHAAIKLKLDNGEAMPEYMKNHPVMYAGPAKTPDGYACGSMGPTTSGRMDPYVELFQSLGGSMVMIGKGNRSEMVTEACKRWGGFYLGTTGGPAALLAEHNIKSIECVEFPDYGMEAVWKVTVEDFPAFILVDDKGNDFFKTIRKPEVL